MGCARDVCTQRGHAVREEKRGRSPGGPRAGLKESSDSYAVRRTLHSRKAATRVTQTSRAGRHFFISPYREEDHDES
jgi:hypothetical protein